MKPPKLTQNHTQMSSLDLYLFRFDFCPDIRGSLSFYWYAQATSLCGYTPSFTNMVFVVQISTLAHWDASRANRVLRNLVSMYHSHSHSTSPEDTQVAAEALANLHLYLSNYSPLNTAVLGSEAVCRYLHIRTYGVYHYPIFPIAELGYR